MLSLTKSTKGMQSVIPITWLYYSKDHWKVRTLFSHSKANLHYAKIKLFAILTYENFKNNHKRKRVHIFHNLKDKSQNTKEIILLFLTIHGKIQDLETPSEDITIINGSYYIEKKKEELLQKPKQHVQIRTLLIWVAKIYCLQNSFYSEKVHHLHKHQQI